MEPPKSLFQETVFVTVVCMAQFMTQAGLSISIAPVHIIGDSFGWLVIPYSYQPKFDDKLRFWQRLDLLGATAGISGLVLVNFSWNQAALVGWKNPSTYVLLIIGVVCLGAFASIERKAPCPLLPRSVFTSELAWVLGCIATGWSSFGIIIYYFYQFMEVIKGDSPLLATAKWSAAAASGAVAALVTGSLRSRLPPSVIMFCAMTFFTAGISIFATVPVDQTYWAQAFVVSLITSWGMDMSFPSGTLILSNSMPHHHQGLAASLVVTTVNYSISLGLGFAGTVETHVNEDGHNVLQGYRGALYMGIGLASLGLVLSICFMFTSWRQHGNSQKSHG
ncbi:Major facilitator superfamily domain, general substrate transporter [Penicillium expansum]|uniref:Major facilitator superfamily domain, general substrate transporter n=1 Tax=Penicillium expansum TaxID=27334 RepID=A0A0A2IYH6_PENEN|nr:Major facilitator superfamily domain, general substrate transporter [Penicillium expansum]KGO48147.1 Major facilitator superfamily domain, general substrate transporter [Penicillium expansum]KGO59889.1 Major facilitator superfamily domain, general substrate transporter [Penicillium expansum]KGO68594.1 Major facilitator superfamily domain, general substrate transporter [Penicillium expansum]